MAKFSKIHTHPDETPKHRLTSKDIAFLNQLQYELNTQDHLITADPRYWVIMDEKEVEITNPNESAEYYAIFDEFSHLLAKGNEDVIEFLKKEILETNDEYQNATISENKYGGFIIEYINSPIDYWHIDETINSINQLTDFVHKIDIDFFIKGYNTEFHIVEGTFFLTRNAAEQHLKENEYRYSDNAHTYCMHATNSPEFETLIKLLQETDFSSILI